MIVSSVFFWLEQIRYKAEAYECNTLEQRRLWKVERALPEETRWSCPLGFEGESANWEREENCTGPDLPDPPDNDGTAEAHPVTRAQCLEVEAIKEAKLSPVMRVKGKSLDSLLVTMREEHDIPERVELRKKRHTLGGDLPELIERRKGVFWGLETIDEDSRHSGNYENIWECGSLPLKIHHGDISRTSVIFDETVEELEISKNIPIKYFADISADMVQWLTDLLDSYSLEEDYEMESYSALPIRGYATEITNDQPSARMTLAYIPSPKSVEPKTFEKCTKISVDGKSVKIGKNETLKLENNKLLISDEKGNVKVLVEDFSRFQEQQSKSSKDLLYTYKKMVIKVHIENTEIIETKNIIQRLLGRRTLYSTLESKGIAKNEAVFGNTLENISLREKRDVPEFVTRITRLLESPKNITSEGIYRTSGNMSTIQKIRCKVDLHKLSILDDYKDDADVLAGTLKMFFRELKDSVIGIEQYHVLCDILGGKISGHKRRGLMKKFADKNSPHADTFAATIDVVQNLSRPKRETIEHILRHLLRIISYEEKNCMTLQNMAICWGPSFISFDTGKTRDEVFAMAQKKNAIVELLLRSYKFLESQRPAGPRLSLTSERPSLERMDSCEGLSMKWSSMTALDREDNINEDFVNSLMRRIETHKDMERAYEKSEEGCKMAIKIMSKVKQKSSKTLPRLLEKAKIEELCTLLRYCYDDQLIPTIRSADYSKLEEIRDSLNRTYDDPNKVALEMYDKIRALAKKQMLFKKFVPLFAHFHKIMEACADPVSKLQEISVFWFKTICGFECKGTSLALVFLIIDAFKETDWIMSEDEQEESEIKTSTAEIILRPSKSSAGGLFLISEENTVEERDKQAMKCDDVVDCCTKKRPATCAYTKADTIMD